MLIARAVRISGGPGLGGLTRHALRDAARRPPRSRRAAVHGAGTPPPEPPTTVGGQEVSRGRQLPRTVARHTGSWRWRYRTSDISLTSNRPYLSRSDAEKAAGTAYRHHSLKLVEPRRRAGDADRPCHPAARPAGRDGERLACAVSDRNLAPAAQKMTSRRGRPKLRSVERDMVEREAVFQFVPVSPKVLQRTGPTTLSRATPVRLY